FLAPNPFRKVPFGPERSAAEIVHSFHETLDSKGYIFLFYDYISKESRIRCSVNGMMLTVDFIKKDPSIYVKTNRDIPERYTHPLNDKIGSKYFGRLGTSKNSPSSGYLEPLMDNSFFMSSNLINAGYQYLRKNWASIANLKIGKKIAETCSIFSHDEYIDIIIEPFLGQSLSLYAYCKDGKRIRLGDLGEGVQNFIVARMLYEVENSKLLLWDDIEAHLNPRMILYISEWFSDLLQDGRQIILTTHSIEATRMIASLNEDKAKIYLISLKDGILETKELTLKEFEEIYDDGIDGRTAEPFLL
ncbi:MAG: AAA family ATPase, partial [Promethearchaeota archaeon]